MPNRDRRVDAYIAKAPEFAKPIIEAVRDAVHAALPEVEETMKWSTPFFDYKGPICMIAAFKEHCRFGFWKGSLVTGDKSAEKMARITSARELPPKKELVAMVKKAARLNEEGVKPKRVPKEAKAPVETPDDLAAAFRKNRKAKSFFDDFSPSQRREYIEWITAAKAAETRQRRLEQAVEWIAEGKPRNWKYMKK